MSDLIASCIALAAYRAMNDSDTKTRPLPRHVRMAAWRVFDAWWRGQGRTHGPWMHA